MQNLRVIKILVVDRHAVVGRGVSTILDAYSDFEVVGQAESGEEALQLMEKCDPNIVAIDIDLTGRLSGLEAIRVLRRKYTDTKIVVLTNLLEEMTVRSALQAGVVSYLLKTVSLDDLARALRDAQRGISTLSPDVTQLVIREQSSPIRNGSNLTSREYEVLAFMANGSNNHEIATNLNISISTVQFHVSNILQKLQVRNRIQAAAFAVRNKLVGSVTDAHDQLQLRNREDTLDRWVDQPGHSGGYPASKVKEAAADARAQGMAAWGQGARGAEGYDDRGESELHTGRQDKE